MVLRRWLETVDLSCFWQVETLPGADRRRLVWTCWELAGDSAQVDLEVDLETVHLEAYLEMVLGGALGAGWRLSIWMRWTR